MKKSYFRLLMILFALAPHVQAQEDADDQPVEVSDAPELLRGQHRSYAVKITPVTRNEGEVIQGVQLSDSGKPLLPIVIATKASQQTKIAAADLQRYLSQISGGQFSVETPDEKPADLTIKNYSPAQRLQQRAVEDARRAMPPEELPKAGLVVGDLDEWIVNGLEDELAIHNGFEGKEAYVIRTTPKRVLLLGATAMGASAATYRLLSEIGCYWLAPAEEWEVVPSIPNLAWNKNITDRPQLLSRSIWYKTVFDVGTQGHPSGKNSTVDYGNWRRRNAHVESIKVQSGHNYRNIIIANQKEYDANPDYAPLINGERIKGKYVGVQPDLSTPGVRKMFVRYALDYFRNNPDADMVSLEPNDSGSYSQSDAFKSLGSISDAVFGMANEVAREVQKEFPGKMVGLLAYREHGDPPSFPLEPNVYVQITGAIFSKYSREELIDQWSQKVSNLGFYDYYSVYYWHFDRPPGGGINAVNSYAENIRNQIGHNATSIAGEASGSWALNGPAYWILNKIMWNPSLDVEALRREYFRAAYGPGAENMRRFYELTNPENKVVSAQNTIYQLALEVQAASEKAKARPDVIARLDHIKQYLRYLELTWRLEAIPAKEPVEKREAAFTEVFKHLYRTRFSYMTHWALATQGLFRDLSGKAKLTDPKTMKIANLSLAPSRPAPENPWKIETPYTHQETADNFLETLQFFKSDPIEMLSFSNDYVAVDWNSQDVEKFNSSKPIADWISYVFQARTVPFWWRSKSGEAFKIRLEAIAATGDRKNRSWWLYDDKGTLIQQGEISIEEKEHVLEVPVPEPGLYNFKIRDTGGIIRAGLDATSDIAVDVSGSAKPGSARYIYVPKGTRQLQFFLKDIGKVRVIGPDNKVAFDGNSSRTFTNVPVPPGLDGKLWFLQLPPTRFTAANLPPILGFSPAGVLVPRELAERDGLKILR